MSINGDALALAAGVAVAFIVMPAMLMFRLTDVFTLMVRVGLSFLITYVVIYLLVHIGQRIVFNEIEKERKQAMAARRQAAREQANRDKEQDGDTHEAL